MARFGNSLLPFPPFSDKGTVASLDAGFISKFSGFAISVKFQTVIYCNRGTSPRCIKHFQQKHSSFSPSRASSGTLITLFACFLRYEIGRGPCSLAKETFLFFALGNSCRDNGNSPSPSRAVGDVLCGGIGDLGIRENGFSNSNMMPFANRLTSGSLLPYRMYANVNAAPIAWLALKAHSNCKKLHSSAPGQGPSKYPSILILSALEFKQLRLSSPFFILPQRTPCS